jgi:hypothetical protein
MSSVHIRSIGIRIAGGMNFLLGGAVIAAGWLALGDSFDSSPALSSLVSGALIVLCSALRAMKPDRTFSLSGTNMALGFWVAVSPWTYGYTNDTTRLIWMIALGVGVMAVSVGGLCCTLRAEREAT